MRKSRLSALVALLAALWGIATPATGGTLYVHAQSAPVFETPAPDSPSLHTLIYGDQITVGDERATSTPDHWTHGTADAESTKISGYIHSNALLPVPTPDLSLSGFQSLTNQLQQIGSETSERIEDITTQTQDYESGVKLITRTFHMSYGDFEEQHLLISDITVSQGFILARAIVNQDGSKSEHMMRTPKLETDEKGAAFVFDDDYWQIISVKQTSDGVLIQFPERAD